ncbi:MAG: FAD-binding oxidoreductase [Candidatus Eremiobacteraeota bacterium]|nr:FAD-binding oxidoreductase [Candidatus Eremiobacteraeota bacterium]
MKTYDVIIIGAGSIGLPLAWTLSGESLKVLVIERLASPGQGQNKAAIGGIRATHSDPAKITVCQQSLEVFSTWQERYGDDIGWVKGGYAFPAYTEQIEKTLRELLVIQKKYRLAIEWVDGKTLREIIPGLSERDLRGGTLSGEDGNLCPLMAAEAFYRAAKRQGARFHFQEEVTEVALKNGKKQVKTTKGSYEARYCIFAAGAEAREAGKMLGLEIPVTPDCHEAGITEPVALFFKPLVVDIRERPGSKNFYFYQNDLGQIVFCITPSPLIVGHDRDSTSEFLPMVAQRLIEVMPRLRHIKVRRTWRGLYPMTPDGIPFVDEVKGSDGVYIAAGMCGQGLMLGPGIARNLTSLILRGKPLVEEEIFRAFSLCREFTCVELLK